MRTGWGGRHAALFHKRHCALPSSDSWRPGSLKECWRAWGGPRPLTGRACSSPFSLPAARSRTSMIHQPRQCSGVAWRPSTRAPSSRQSPAEKRAYPCHHAVTLCSTLQVSFARGTWRLSAPPTPYNNFLTRGIAWRPSTRAPSSRQFPTKQHARPHHHAVRPCRMLRKAFPHASGDCTPYNYTDPQPALSREQQLLAFHSFHFLASGWQ